ncbi:MAG: homocysteine S-methyltransferase family protein [Clostridia bacterium]|nr:homocysteine S-methyltransferase family protein [Clostridia bacterium]
MTRTEFSAWCASGVHFLDGATGSNLMKAGMPKAVCTEKWNLEHPEAILALQRAYLQSGSEIVYAPTFGANRVLLANHGLEGKVSELNRALAALSRQAVGNAAMVAGDMTTTGRPVDPEDNGQYALLLDVYKEQAEALLEGGVELFAVETMMGVTECMAAVEAIRSLCELPVLCTLSVQSDGKCYFDGNAMEAAEILEQLGADTVGINCSAGPDQLESVVRGMKNACSLPIAAKPNAGLPQISETGEAIYAMGSEAFAEHMKKLADAGASLLGGCCGTTPEHIAALCRAFK